MENLKYDVKAKQDLQSLAASTRKIQIADHSVLLLYTDQYCSPPSQVLTPSCFFVKASITSLNVSSSTPLCARAWKLFVLTLNTLLHIAMNKKRIKRAFQKKLASDTFRVWRGIIHTWSRCLKAAMSELGRVMPVRGVSSLVLPAC